MRAIMLVFTLVCFAFLHCAHSCSRILYNSEKVGVMVGRTMDWSTSLSNLMQTNLLVYPRGIERNGNTPINPLHWKAKYGSMVATALNDTIAVDGVNEWGFAAHTLWFSRADYGKRDAQRPGLLVTMWVQFALDNFNSVEEAVNYFQKSNLQITPFLIPGVNKPAPLHLVFDDATGDSAILEYENGQLHVYHDAKYVVATNEPSYNEQLANAAQYIGLGGTKPLPGSLAPQDRFVRASYFLKYLPEPTSLKNQIAEIKSVLNVIAEPFEVVSSNTRDPIPTNWYVIADLTHPTYYFQDIANANLVWAELGQFDLTQGAPVMKLDLVHQDELVGNVNKQFKPLS